MLSGLIELRAVTADELFIEANPDVVARILKNLLQAASWAESFPKEALRHVAVEGRVEEADAVAAYGAHIADGARLGLEIDRLQRLAELQACLKVRHLVPDDHDIDTWLRSDILDDAQQRSKAPRRIPA